MKTNDQTNMFSILVLSKLQDSLMNIADQNWRMFCYGWVSIPLGNQIFSFFLLHNFSSF